MDYMDNSYANIIVNICTVFPRSDAAATINFPLLALAATIRGRRLLEGGVNYNLHDSLLFRGVAKFTRSEERGCGFVLRKFQQARTAKVCTLGHSKLISCFPSCRAALRHAGGRYISSTEACGRAVRSVGSEFES